MTPSLSRKWEGRYVDESLLGRFKRFIGIRDGYQICCDCKKTFFNLCKSEICYPCWSKPEIGMSCILCKSLEHRECDCPKISGYTIDQSPQTKRGNSP